MRAASGAGDQERNQGAGAGRQEVHAARGSDHRKERIVQGAHRHRIPAQFDNAGDHG